MIAGRIAVIAPVVSPAGCAGPPARDFVLAGVCGLTKVAQVTGPATHRYGVHGTDLGSAFTMGERTYLVFGDTFGERQEGQTGAGGGFWRSNVMAYTTDADLSDGVRLDGMITDEAGLAKELLPSRKVDHDEITVIPTYGFAVGEAMYLHYMSVRHWGAPGHWEVNHSGLARSDDRGQTWTVLDAPTWPGESGFAQVSVAREGRYLYLWSIPAGRFGGVSLMRVPAGQVERPEAYEYRTARGWSADRAKATLVVDDTVGELSVVRNSHLDRWIMLYLREGTGVVIREGLTPWGPWSEPITAVSATDHPGLYAPFLYPGPSSDGSRVYFNLSLWEPYNVFLFRLDLRKHGDIPTEAKEQTCEGS
ncbi:DUF4185 domain-containing protein [Thermoactinospora rubra]|uniref:DUF4185 domain-containing protein n=1 Tax=Thermoactinospora rubra TaxID=1088767 RepID=UPI00197F0047|nr:DUF4185 domain-containing protein [Thermoactinospora rubra]